MAADYKVAVHLAMASNATAFFSALSSKILHTHAEVKALEGGLSRLSRIKLAIGGGLAIAGGTATLTMLGKMVDKGNELVKVQQNMAAAGVKAADVQEAYAKAWQLTGKYRNVGAAEALKVISEARMTFGSQHDATHHAEDFVKMISFLKAFQGGKHGAGAANFEAEAIAAMKSGEIAGKVSPAEMAEHVKQLTAMRVAYGDQLKITQYLTAQRAGGVALRNTSDEFRYGMFPALVQENGSNAGVMLMTAFNKIVAGTGNRTKSLEHMAEIGLLKRDQLQYDKNGRIKGLKDPSAIKDNREAAINFGDWVFKTLKPLLDKQTQDPIRQAQLISAMFPDRNAAKAITEIVQQYSKLSKDAALMGEARRSLNEGAYVDKSYEGQKQAFHEQWENTLQALGAPMVGQATDMLRRLNDALSGMAQWAGRPENAESVAMIFRGLAIGAAALTGAGAAALLAALGPAGWLVGGITAMVASWAAVDSASFTATITAIKNASASIANTVTDPEVLNRLSMFWALAGSEAAILYSKLQAIATSTDAFGKLSMFWALAESEALILYEKLKGFAPDTEKLSAMFKNALSTDSGDLALIMKGLNYVGEWYTTVLGWRQTLQDKLLSFLGANSEMPGKSLASGMSESAREAIANRAAIDDPMGRIVTMIIDEFKSWPARLADAIAAMGSGIVAAIGDKLKNLFTFGGAGGEGVQLGSPMSFEGGGLGGLIHKASLGGANDNALGSFGAGSVARGISRGGGGAVVPRGDATIGTGKGDSWYEAVMRAEGTAGKDPYNVVLGNGRYGLPSKPLTDMTLAEAHAFGRTVRARHGASSALGAFQIVGRTMNTFMGEAGLGPNDKFSPENQRKLADVIRRRQGFGAWEGLKLHRGEWNKAAQGRGLAPPPPAPPVAGPPPPKPREEWVSNIHLDGKVIARSTAKHMVADARFSRHVGGMDTHGSYRPPGTTLTDAA